MEDILNLTSDKFNKDEEFGFDFSLITKIKSNQNYDLSILKNYEIRIIDRVIDKFKNMNCKEISELSHREDAWKDTEVNELISYEYSQTLTI